MPSLASLQEILRRLFRLDESVDLDFGIYRLINLKREHLTKYLDEQLPQQVQGVIGQSSQKASDVKLADLQNARERVLQTLGEEALDADGNLDQALGKTPAGRNYLLVRKDTPDLKTAEQMQDEIYDHLASFFSRYECGGGDIVPRRRHSVRNRYAVPHNGEEVMLHWANRDQHYIKTAAYHPSMTFKTGGKRFVFRITDAQDTPRDNNKDSGRVLLPQIDKAGKDDNGDMVVPFIFRALNKKEQKHYKELGNGGNGNGGRLQSGVLAEALQQLVPAAAKKKGTPLQPLLADGGDGKPAFMRYAGRFVRRNTADFFIHRNLKGFLSDELDFYLKSETLNADELARLSGSAVASRMIAFHAIRELGNNIIEALAQWEDLQKALWEKRKFVLQTEYCATLGHIPNLEESGLLDAIAKCDKQWEEWEQLGINGKAAPLFAKGSKTEKRIAWLRENPSLPVDTANFPPEFKDELLAQFEDIDDVTDGVLIHGENWQALDLIQEMYRKRVSCIHIDPPYNTDTSGFLYKNNFKHSSWMTMMDSRISIALPLLSSDGVFQCHIDENEYERLHFLFEQTPTINAGTVVWDKRTPVAGKKGVATQHEYIIWRMMSETRFFKRKPNAPKILDKAAALLAAHGGKVTDELRKEFRDWVEKQKKFSSGEKGFKEMDDSGKVYQSVHMGAPEQRLDPKFHTPLIHPKTGKPCPVPDSGWSSIPEFMQNLLQEGRILFGKDETTQPRRIYYLHENTHEPVSTVVGHGRRGKKDLDRLRLAFPYAHSVDLYMTLVESVIGTPNIVLDYFAGSGTTAHAIINLNREGGIQRKFILAEVGEHFNTTLIPRIKKITYSPGWKNGKATDTATPEDVRHGPRLIKYQRIESYEDALANIRFESDGLGFDDDTLHYELNWDTHESPTWLLEKGMDSPFDYQLNLVASNAENSNSTHKEHADLPETFAYLLGLRVKTRRIVMDGKRRYLVQRGIAADKDTVVIWRDIAGWKDDDYAREQKFIKESELMKGAERVLLNGNNALKGGESLNPDFGRRMFLKS